MSLYNYFVNAFDVSYSSITLFNLKLPFWLITIILTLYIIATNVKPIKKFIVKTINSLINIIKKVLKWIKKQIINLFNTLKNLRKYRKGLTEYHDKYKLCVILLLNSLLLYLLITLLYDSFKSYMSTLGLAFSVLVIIIVLYSLYAMFVSSIPFKSNSTIYIIFPILYLITFWSKTKYTLVNENVSGLIYNGIVLVLLIIHTIVAYKFKELNVKIKPSVIVLISLLIFLVGSILIIDFTQEEKHILGLKLNDCKTSKQFHNAEILCKNQLGKVFTDSKATCNLINIDLTNISGIFRFTLLNGTTTTQNFTNSIYFLAPEKVGNVYIEMDAYYNNKKMCLSSGHSQTFATYEQYKQNKKDFATYLAALIGFVLVTVPSIYKKWKEVFSDSEKNEDRK